MSVIRSIFFTLSFLCCFSRLHTDIHKSRSSSCLVHTCQYILTLKHPIRKKDEAIIARVVRAHQGTLSVKAGSAGIYAINMNAHKSPEKGIDNIA